MEHATPTLWTSLHVKNNGLPSAVKHLAQHGNTLGLIPTNTQEQKQNSNSFLQLSVLFVCWGHGAHAEVRGKCANSGR